MSQEKYIGLDVHQASISAAVMDPSGNVLMECLLETKAATILEFIQGLRGTLSLTFEEGTAAAWLHDLLKPHVSRLVVCDPRKAALLKEGNKNDRVDARKLAELLRTNQLKAVYHGEHGIRTLKELGRSYLTVSKEITRTMNRIKSLYRSWAIPCSGTTVYAPRHRGEWLAKIMEPGVRVRAQHLYQQLDNLQPLRLEARRELLLESHKHAAVKLLRQIPSIGPIRAALLVALLQTPHRFRSKRQLWAYSGFAVETYDSGEYRIVRGKLQRNREQWRSEWQVICEVCDGLQAVEKAAELRPDVVLLDIGMPTLNGIEAAKRIRQGSPGSRIIFVATGAEAYLVKANAGSELLPAIDAALGNGHASAEW